MRRQSPLTGIEVDTRREPSTDTTFYYDPVCGDYAIGFDEPLGELSQDEVLRIAKVLATRKLRYGDQSPLLTKAKTGNLGSWTYVPIGELLAEYPKTVPGVLDAAIVNMSRMISFPSDAVEITNLNRWAIFAHDYSSQNYVLRQLTEMGYIRPTRPESVDPELPRYYSIEAPGWERLSRLEANGSGARQAFVAMWFAPETELVYRDGILPAVVDTGFECIRIDRKEHNNKICDEIIAEIRRSRFLIADFSGNRGGVYFEAGFAYGLGIPVIWVVREQDLKGIHFDTRQYNHILYTDAETLHQSLVHRILATITK